MSRAVEYKTTSKGTQLPLLDLRGKSYLQVAHRLVWFREDHPLGRIETAVVEQTNDHAVVRASIYSTSSDSAGQPIHLLLSTATKKETLDGFPDFIEKAETGAVGRALAMAGYGTQFEPEFDEGERLADSPIQPAKKVDVKPKAEPKPAATPKAVAAPNDRTKINSLILATKKVCIDKKKFDESVWLNTLEAYEVKDVTALTDDKARELLSKLEEKAR